jgi:hypothetical protein
MTQLVPHQQPQASGFAAAIRPNNMQEAMQFVQGLAKSSIAAQFNGDVYAILGAIERGESFGYSVFQSLQNIMYVNGKWTVYGDAMLAICRASRTCQDVVESFDDESSTATCTALRQGCRPVVRTFSLADARTAGLTNKGPWKSYPKRMLQMRARSFALRDAFADLLAGIAMQEEVRDYDMKNQHGKKVPRPLPHTVVEAAPKEPAQQPAEARHATEPLDAPQDPPAPAEASTTPEQQLRSLHLAISVADSTEELNRAVEFAKSLPEQVSKNARQAFLAKQKEIARREEPTPEQASSNAARMLSEYEG